VLDPQDLGGLDHVARDEHGHQRLADVDIGDMLRREVTEGMKGIGLGATIVVKHVGYELRCIDPIPFDMEYTRDLGYCAAPVLLDGGTSAMVSIHNGRFTPNRFQHVGSNAMGT
jgi:6-phosphofructokinase 1